MANYSRGKIAIPNVTGDVVINVTAVKQGYINIWEAPYKLDSRINTAETDPAYSGMYISAWYSLENVNPLTTDLVFRSNKDLWNYNALSSGGDCLKGYNTATTGDKVGMPTADMTSIYFVRGYDESTGIYSLTVKHSYWTGSAPNYIRWCAMTPQKPLTASYFDGCILTIDQPIS